MAHIIEIDAFMPAEGLVFRYQGKDFPVPADPPLPILFELLHLNDAALSGDTSANGIAGQVAGFERLHASLFEFFKLQTPDLSALPFGRIGVGVVTRALLQFYGLVEAPADPPTETPAATTKRGGSPRRSRSSSGSRS